MTEKKDYQGGVNMFEMNGTFHVVEEVAAYNVALPVLGHGETEADAVLFALLKFANALGECLSKLRLCHEVLGVPFDEEKYRPKSCLVKEGEKEYKYLLGETYCIGEELHRKWSPLYEKENKNETS